MCISRQAPSKCRPDLVSWMGRAFNAINRERGKFMALHLGQPRSVHVASARQPLPGQRHEFTPSPFGKAARGKQCLRGSSSPLPPSPGQRKLVQLASCFRPLCGQSQVLQPSAAENSTPGQHWSSALGLCGGVKHFKLVQVALLFKPLNGHMQVFKPSPAGYTTRGVHLPSGPGLVKHSIFVQVAWLFTPLAGHVQVLHPSAAVHDKCGQHWSSGCGSSGSAG